MSQKKEGFKLNFSISSNATSQNGIFENRKMNSKYERIHTLSFRLMSFINLDFSFKIFSCFLSLLCDGRYCMHKLIENYTHPKTEVCMCVLYEWIKENLYQVFDFQREYRQSNCNNNMIWYITLMYDNMNDESV